MSCLKCGQEVSSGQIFCDACLADMAKHPVDPSTPVIIPKRTRPLPAKRGHKRLQKPEDLITTQRRIIWLLIAIIIFLMLVIGALSFTAVHYHNMVQTPALAAVTAAENVSRETISDSI